MAIKRRSFIKKALGAGAFVLASTATAAIASTKKIDKSTSSGVIIGQSNKKEILYKETKNWDAFYKASY